MIHVSATALAMKFHWISTAYKKAKKLVPRFAIYTAYLMGSLGHWTG